MKSRIYADLSFVPMWSGEDDPRSMIGDTILNTVLSRLHGVPIANFRLFHPDGFATHIDEIKKANLLEDAARHASAHDLWGRT